MTISYLGAGVNNTEYSLRMVEALANVLVEASWG